jgi:hypothetical protein
VRQPISRTTDATIIESTIDAGRNGVQTNPLGARLASYPKGSRVSWYPLNAETRVRVDLEAFYACCGANDGITHYSIQQLVQFLLPDWIDQRVVPKDADVCSVWAATALRAAKAAPDITPWRMKPSDVIALPIFNPGVPILDGKD